MTILLSAGVWAPICIWRAKNNLEAEVESFESCKKKLSFLSASIQNGKDAYEAVVADASDMIMKSSMDVQQYIYAGVTEDKKVLNTGYVSDRLFAVLQSVNPHNLVRKTPELSDLHELTMQRERSSIATSMFRALAPCILVIGILGTLLGVHNKLDEVSGEPGISALTDALIPGALAVFFTVLVMVFRGYYNRKLSEFISAFDEYTLNTLLILFQPESQSSADTVRLNNVLRDIKLGKKTMEEILYGVKMLYDVSRESENDCVDLLRKTQQNLNSMGEVMDASYKNQEALAELRTSTSRILFAQSQMRHAYYENLAAIKKLLDKAERMFGKVYEELGYKGISYLHGMESLGVALKQFQTASNKLKSHVEASFSMPSVSSSLAELQQLNHHLKMLPDYVLRYMQNENDINAADALIDKKIEEMAALEHRAHVLHSTLTKQFNEVRDDSVAFFEAYRKLQMETVNVKLREYMVKVSHMKERKPKDTPHGIFVWLKNRMMKLRLFYRRPIGIATMLLLLLLLIVWNLWVWL